MRSANVLDADVRFSKLLHLRVVRFADQLDVSSLGAKSINLDGTRPCHDGLGGNGFKSAIAQIFGSTMVGS